MSPLQRETPADLSLFDAPRPLTDAERKADIEAWLWRLVPLAVEMAYAAGEYGVTVGEIRIEAEKRGLATGDESKTRGSYLWRVPKMAGLLKTKDRRSSKVKAAHHNPNIVHVAPEFARAA